MKRMKSKWKVMSNMIDAKTMYRVYRILDINEPDHSGNREYFAGYMESHDEAEVIAANLNREKGK